MINRSALVISPAEPYIAWASKLAGADSDPEVADQRTVYLLPVEDDDLDGEDVLKRSFSDIFEQELFAWDPDESAWPSDRGYDAFMEWFDVEWIDEVHDLGEDEIEDF